MISASIQNVTKAEAEEHGPGEYHDGFSVVTVFGDSRNINETVKLFLPAGTAAAVAACINVAVAAGAKAAEKEAARKRWHEVCEAMNRGTWTGSEAEALAEVARCKAIVEQVAA